MKREPGEPKPKEEVKHAPARTERMCDSDELQVGDLIKRPPASEGTDWRDSMHARRDPRPDSWEYRKRFAFIDLRDLMGSYKRTKYSHQQVTEELNAMATQILVSAEALKVTVDFGALSAYNSGNEE